MPPQMLHVTPHTPDRMDASLRGYTPPRCTESLSFTTVTPPPQQKQPPTSTPQCPNGRSPSGDPAWVEEIKSVVQGLASRQEEERQVNDKHREQSRDDRHHMKQDMKELANIQDEVTECVCDTVTDNLEKHMKVFVAATRDQGASSKRRMGC